MIKHRICFPISLNWSPLELEPIGAHWKPPRSPGALAGLSRHQDETRHLPMCGFFASFFFLRCVFLFRLVGPTSTNTKGANALISELSSFVLWTGASLERAETTMVSRVDMATHSQNGTSVSGTVFQTPRRRRPISMESSWQVGRTEDRH